MPCHGDLSPQNVVRYAVMLRMLSVVDLENARYLKTIFFTAGLRMARVHVGDMDMPNDLPVKLTPREKQ